MDFGTAAVPRALAAAAVAGTVTAVITEWLLRR